MKIEGVKIGGMRGHDKTTAERYFDDENKTIVSHYKDSIPSPNPELEVVTVIPAYAELDNGNLWRMLDAFSLNASPKHEVLYVVNNSSKRGRNKREYEENKRTVQLLKLLQEETEYYNEHRKHTHNLGWRIKKLSPNINEYNVEVFKRAIKNGISFNVVDVTEPDTLYKYIESRYSYNCRAMARDIGAHIAFGRLKEVGREESGYVDFLDADSFPYGSEYVSGLLQVAEEGHKGVIRKPLIVRPTEPDFDYMSDYLTGEQGGNRKYNKNTNRFLQLLQYFHTIGEAYMQYSLGDETNVHGPQLMAQAQDIRAIGGYAGEGTSTILEDWYAGDRIKKMYPGSDSKVSSARVRLMHRVRDGSVDGRIDFHRNIDQLSPENVIALIGAESTTIRQIKKDAPPQERDKLFNKLTGERRPVFIDNASKTWSMFKERYKTPEEQKEHLKKAVRMHNLLVAKRKQILKDALTRVASKKSVTRNKKHDFSANAGGRVFERFLNDALFMVRYSKHKKFMPRVGDGAHESIAKEKDEVSAGKLIMALLPQFFTTIQMGEEDILAGINELIDSDPHLAGIRYTDGFYVCMIALEQYIAQRSVPRE